MQIRPTRKKKRALATELSLRLLSPLTTRVLQVLRSLDYGGAKLYAVPQLVEVIAAFFLSLSHKAWRRRGRKEQKMREGKDKKEKERYTGN